MLKVDELGRHFTTLGDDKLDRNHPAKSPLNFVPPRTGDIKRDMEQCRFILLPILPPVFLKRPKKIKACCNYVLMRGLLGVKGKFCCPRCNNWLQGYEIFKSY